MSEANETKVKEACTMIEFWNDQKREAQKKINEIDRKIYDAQCVYIKERWGIEAGTIVVTRRGEECMVTDPNVGFYMYSRPVISVKKRKKDGTWSERQFSLRDFEQYVIAKASACHA